jgi:ribonuclease HI
MAHGGDGRQRKQNGRHHGSGAVYYLPTALQQQRQPTQVTALIEGTVSSLRPEAAALQLLLQKLPTAADAVVFTDSLSLMSSLVAYSSRAGRRRALASPQAPTLKRIAELLANRQGHIRLVKVKSHMGMPLNAEADKLADVGMTEETATPEVDPTATMPLSFRSRRPPPERPQSTFTRDRQEAKQDEAGKKTGHQTPGTAETRVRAQSGPAAGQR